MDASLLDPVLVTLRIAATALLLVAPPAILVAWGLARDRLPWPRLFVVVTTLPLVLPPTAVGYLLLRLLATDGPLGPSRLGFDPGLLLTWRGAVLATAIMAMPLVVRTARVAFEGVDPRLERLARTLGHRPAAVFWRVTLPLARRGLLAALVLGFTRGVGEFGATVVVAGIIPGHTETLASAIYGAQQIGDHRRAALLLGLALGLGIAAVLVSEHLVRTRRPASAPRARRQGGEGGPP